MAVIATPAPIPQAPTADAAFDPDAYLKDAATPAPAADASAAFDPDAYIGDETKKYVDDDNFDPLTLAYEQPDKLDLAKEIEWRKSQRPMTGARALKTAGNVVKAVPGIIKDFGQGLGNIAGDAIIQATDDLPANVERAKTQQLTRAQLIEQHGGSFLSKLLGPDSWLGKHVFTPEKDVQSTAAYERAALERVAPPGPQKDAALAQINAKEQAALAALAAKPKESPRQESDRLFEQKLAQVKRERELVKGNPQPDGLVAGSLEGLGVITHALASGQPVAEGDDSLNVTNTFKNADQLAQMGAPVDQESIRTGAVAADPINLLPLHVPGMNAVAGKVGGALLKAPAAITRTIIENTPEAISAAMKKKIIGGAATAGGGALAYEALKDPASAAKHLAAAGVLATGVAGARYFGRVMDVAGSKMLDPKFVSAAERAGAESAINIEKAGGGQLSKFFDPAMNKADLERALVKPIQGAVTAPIAMAPLNAALADTPEEFGSLSGTAAGFGLFSGATAYNPLKGFHPETVAAVDSILRDNGAKKKYGTPLDAQHEAFMATAPEGVQDAVNSYRGFFDGFKLSSGREPQIYVLPADQFGTEVNKRRADVPADQAAKQRGFIGKDGTILINGDYGGEAPGILGHEAGGHAAMSIMQTLLPEVSASMEAAARKGLTDGKGNPTPQMRKFVEAYNKEFDPTGKQKEIKTESQAINEWLAEQARAVLDGQGPAKYAAGTSVRQKIADNLGDHFQKVFGAKQAFDRSQVPALARQYRDLLFQLGRFRTQEGPQTAPEPAPADAAAPAAPAPGAPAPAAPEAAPAPSSGDRATVAAALRTLFGVKQAEADTMAAAATGSTVEEMIASASQAKSRAVAASRPAAPVPVGAPAGPTGQLGAVKPAEAAPAAPAGQLAGFGEPAPAAKPKIRVSPRGDGTFEYRDADGNLLQPPGEPAPRTGAPDAPNLDRQGATAPVEAPARPVIPPEAIAERVQAAEDAARAAEATKKRRTPESREKATAQAVKEARIQALLDAAHESAPDDTHLQRREEFGTTKYTGRIDESIPAHRMLLDELGVSEGARSNIDTLSDNLGKPVFVTYKSAAKEGFTEAAQASGQVDRTGKQRSKEYKAESVDARIEDAQAGDQNTGVEQTKSFYPLGFRVNPSTGSVTATGFSPQRLLANVGKIVEFMRGKKPTGYQGADDPQVTEDMQGYAQNHANGYKGDGSGPIAGETPTPNYEPYVIPSERFGVLNAAMGNESAKTPKSDREGAKARAGDLQDFAAANDTLATPEGETNPLRQWLNDSGFEFRNPDSGEVRAGTKEVLEPTIESLRVDPELMRGISTEAPDSEASLRPTGVADPSAMTAAGIPKARNVAAGFMPGHGPESRQLSDFGDKQEEPSIKSKVGSDLSNFMPGNKPKTDELGFYSRLRQHVDEAPFGQTKAKTAQHWLGVIQKWAKGASTPTLGVQSRGIARDELEWSGIKEWLQSQGSTPIKKADVLNFIDQNGVKVQEVQKGGGDSKGSAYYMDHEFEDHSYAFDDNEGAWLLDASPSREFFGEDEADRMDREPLIAIFKPKSDIAKNSNVYGDHEAPADERYIAEVDGEEVGRFGDVRAAEKFLAEAVKKHEEEHGQHTQYEIWDAKANHPIRGEVYDTLEEAKSRGMELAADALRDINEQHSLEDGGEDGGTQFSGYKLDGGSNYKEILLTLPTPETMDTLPEGYHLDQFPTDAVNPHHYIMRNAEGRAIVQGDTKQEAISKAVQYLSKGGSDKQLMRRQPFTESHWEEPNVVAHFRQQDFEGMVRPSGESIKDFMDRGGNRETEKVRHIDEFQSDWHQKGRERGYKDGKERNPVEIRDELVALERKYEEAYKDVPTREFEIYNDQVDNPDATDPRFIAANKIRAELDPLIAAKKAELYAAQGSRKVPDAPFKKTWAQLAFKRALKLAVEDGMDRMSWSTGDQNIEHYKNALTAEVDTIQWQDSSRLDKDLAAVGERVVSLRLNRGGEMKLFVDKSGNIARAGGSHRIAGSFVGKELGEVIGQPNARRIMSESEGSMNGEGMEVGGDGMRKFYDEIIPQFAKDYVSKWGSKVEDVTLPTGDTVHSVKITPQMKAAVEGGQPMFMPGNRGKEGGQLSDFGQQDELGFHSGLARIIDAKIPNRASGEQILNTLKGAGAKAEELDLREGQPMFMPGKGPEAPTAGDLSDFDSEPSIKSKVDVDSVKWEQPRRAKAAGDVVVQVNAQAFDDAFKKDHGFYIDSDGNGEIKGRRERFKDFLQEGKPVEMPEVVITKEGTAAFVNGRHRFSVLRDAGIKTLPVSMDETSAMRAQNLGIAEGKPEGGQLGSFMPADQTGRGEFDVKEKKPVDERRARLMADMQAQAAWLGDKAKEKGFDSVEDLMTEDFDGYNDLAKQWREAHPRFDAAGNQMFMPGSQRPEDVFSKPQMEDALERAWNANLRDYYDDPDTPDDPKTWREWVKKDDAYNIALVLDSDSELYHKFFSKLPEDVTPQDLVEAYKADKLPATVAPKAKRPALPMSDVDFTPGGRVGEPESASPIPADELGDLWTQAKQRPTKSTKDAINEARKRLLIQAHTQDLTADLGITQADLNKAFRSWSAYPAQARSLHASLNRGVPEVAEWHGIPNSSFIAKADVSPEDIASMVKTIDAPEGDGWFAPTARSVRNHLARFFMAIDTRIDFGDLTIKVELDPAAYRSKNVRGDYSSNTRTIRLKENSENTVAHELGHYLDHKWALELGVDQLLSDSSFNREIASDKTSAERVEWAERYMEFVDGLTDRSDIHSDYTQSRKEVFARFVDKFAQWTNRQAGARYNGDQSLSRNDRFTESDYRGFVRLLQEKAFVDAKDGNPLGLKRGNPAAEPDAKFLPGSETPDESSDPKRTWFVRGGQRVYHHRGEAGKFAEKPTLAKFGTTATSQTDDNAKAQLETFK